MKIIATADLHYNVSRSRKPTEQLAQALTRVRPDVLLLVGDIAGRSLDVLGDCFELFAPLDCRRLYVPGNHELWVGPGEDSLDRYENQLPELCRQHGVDYLPDGPVVIDGVGFVGSVGWYDYSFRSPRLGIPDRFYQAKVAPGAAAVLARHSHLLEDRGDLTDDQLQITTRWMDGVHVRMDLDDVTFLERLIDRLTGHVAAAAQQVDRIVAAVHHLPFAELVKYSRRDNWDFASAYMGSELLGKVLLAEPKVSHVFCGHSHWPGRVQRDHVTCINVGSTYVLKRYEELSL